MKGFVPQTKETTMVNDEWYKIPGFSSYDIGKHTKYIRSHKHYKRDYHHIMKQSIEQFDENPKILLTDDAGISRKVDREFLYNKTFNMGFELVKRPENEIYMGGMNTINRYRKSTIQPVNLDINFPTENNYAYTTSGLSPIIQLDDNNYTLDFSCPISTKLVKPFTYDYSLNK